MSKLDETTYPFAFTKNVEISLDTIRNLLCSALEGGSNYWYFIEEMIQPKKIVNRRYKDDTFKHLDYPINEGGALIIRLNDDIFYELNCYDYREERKKYDNRDDFYQFLKERNTERWTLNLEAMINGLKIMSEKYKRHFKDVINQNEDSITGDVFLQCSLFGKVIYG